MTRAIVLVFFGLLLALVLSAPVRAQPQPGASPRLYELVIDGESFLIEANRLEKLQSKARPGVAYEVALRVAPTQRLRLGSVQFDYDWLSKVEDNRKAAHRTARLAHELGFTMLISELGEPLEPKDQDETLKTLVDSVVETYREMKVAKLDLGQPRPRKFEGSAGRGVVIRYQDAQGLGRTSLVYLLVGPKFTVSCIVQYLDRDSDDVLPLVKRTLDSFRPVP